MAQQKDFVSVRLDEELKAELLQAAELEHRSLSNFCRLLLEFAWSRYLQAGSVNELVEGRPQSPPSLRGLVARQLKDIERGSE
jgi:hypothetical protein